MIAIFPEIEQCAREKNIELLAVLARKYFGATRARSPHIDVEQLVRDAGIEVQDMDVGGAQGAVAAKDEAGVFKIVLAVRPGLGRSDRQFLLSYLFGKILLEVLPEIANADWKNQGHKEINNPLLRFERGQAAESPEDAMCLQFASALLLPKAMLLQAWGKLASVKKIAVFFGVSEGCVEQRLTLLNDRTAQSPRNFTEAEARMPQAKPDLVSQTARSVDTTREPPTLEQTEYRGKPKENQASTEASTVEGKDDQANQLKGMARLRQIARQLDKGV